ncbi:MAG: Pvc16 family protein [Leptolyngbya sp. Prado105]|jgi:hypothetical protein|nr:Pvc16 family protein [Leptolyngbya sp. Prado105]
MISAISKTLASVLAIETSLPGIEQVDFNPPSDALSGKATLNIYCYNYCWDEKKPLRSQVDLAFVISAWDTPAWGEQALLSEALSSLQNHPQLEAQFLSAELEEARSLSIEVNSIPAIEPVVLWESLGLPMRPALYVTVKVPS